MFLPCTKDGNVLYVRVDFETVNPVQWFVLRPSAFVSGDALCQWISQ